MMMEHKLHAGIIGLGLIGGSMGLALRELQMFACIAGFDNNPLHSQQALSLGLVDECIDLRELITQSDVIFLATPVEAIISLMPQLTHIKPSATIIDLGGTKERIIQHIPDSIRKNFVATHPMAGTEFYGPKAALPNLFKDSIVILASLQDSGDSQVQIAREIFLGIGMKIIKMDAHEHDKHIALISHMPHVISYALANAVLKQEDPQTILALIGGGFKSMSRLSKSSPKMWSDIFKQNTQNVLDSITSFQNELQKAKDMLQSKDWEGLEAFMAQANKLQDFM